MSANDAPKFESDVPPALLFGKTEAEKWMFNQQSIQRQHLEHISKRLNEGDERFTTLDESFATLSGRVDGYDKIKERITAKWSVIVFVLCAVGGPVTLCIISAWAIRWFEKNWK